MAMVDWARGAEAGEGREAATAAAIEVGESTAVAAAANESAATAVAHWEVQRWVRRRCGTKVGRGDQAATAVASGDGAEGRGGSKWWRRCRGLVGGGRTGGEHGGCGGEVDGDGGETEAVAARGAAAPPARATRRRRPDSLFEAAPGAAAHGILELFDRAQPLAMRRALQLSGVRIDKVLCGNVRLNSVPIAHVAAHTHRVEAAGRCARRGLAAADRTTRLLCALTDGDTARGRCRVAVAIGEVARAHAGAVRVDQVEWAQWR